MRPLPLSPDQQEAFERDGFIGPIDVLSPNEVLALRNAVAEVIDNLERHRERLYEVEQAYTDRPGEVVCHFLGGFRVHPALHQLIFLPRITAPCAQDGASITFGSNFTTLATHTSFWSDANHLTSRDYSASGSLTSASSLWSRPSEYVPSTPPRGAWSNTNRESSTGGW